MGYRSRLFHPPVGNKKVVAHLWRYMRLDAPIPIEVIRSTQGNPLLGHLAHINYGNTWEDRYAQEKVDKESLAAAQEDRLMADFIGDSVPLYEGARLRRDQVPFYVDMTDDSWMDDPINPFDIDT